MWCVKKDFHKKNLFACFSESLGPEHFTAQKVSINIYNSNIFNFLTIFFRINFIANIPIFLCFFWINFLIFIVWKYNPLHTILLIRIWIVFRLYIIFIKATLSAMRSWSSTERTLLTTLSSLHLRKNHNNFQYKK